MIEFLSLGQCVSACDRLAVLPRAGHCKKMMCVWCGVLTQLARYLARLSCEKIVGENQKNLFFTSRYMQVAPLQHKQQHMHTTNEPEPALPARSMRVLICELYLIICLFSAAKVVNRNETAKFISHRAVGFVGLIPSKSKCKYLILRSFSIYLFPKRNRCFILVYRMSP